MRVDITGYLCTLVESRYFIHLCFSVKHCVLVCTWVCVLDTCHRGGVLVGCIGIGVLCVGVVGYLLVV